jgi:DNA mismatch endonuclease (patch repair protein)
MRANKGKDTAPELRLRALLREAGFRGYRLHWRKAPGHPDIAFPGRRIAVFVHGCFWHQCPHCNPPSPKTNREFWLAKFEDNRRRDERNQRALEEDGWSVIIVWECELQRDERAVLEAVVSRLRTTAE